MIDGIILDQAEYLVFMDALHCSKVIGIDSERLFPDDIEEHRALIHQGIEQLQQRGWMQIQDGRHIISRDLLRVMNTIAHPERVLSTLLKTSQGQRIFLHYQSQGHFAEQTFPTAEQYRVGRLPDRDTLISRVLQILPLQATAPAPQFHIEMAHSLLLALLKLDASATDKQVAALLREHGLPADNLEGITALLAAIHAAAFTGILTVYECAEKRCRLTTNITLIQGQTSTWQIQEHPATDSAEVQTLDAPHFKQYLSQLVTT